MTPTAQYDLAWTAAELEAQMRALRRGYHLEHPLEQRIADGRMSHAQLGVWVANRYYYQAMIPRKDALILAACDDREVRRRWRQRIIDQDGDAKGDNAGGLEAWLQLGMALAIPRDDLQQFTRVVPGVRFAVDAYFNFVRHAPWQEAVCASLTELFAGEAHARRLAAFPIHYPFVPADALAYFRKRVGELPNDVDHGLSLTLAHFTTRAQQDRALDVIRFKLDVLWAMADAILGAVGAADGLQQGAAR